MQLLELQRSWWEFTDRADWKSEKRRVENVNDFGKGKIYEMKEILVN